MNAQRFGIISGTEKQRNLHDALMDKVYDTANSTRRAKQSDSQDNIGHLTDSGISQTAFEVVLPKRAQRPPNDGD